jgi:hypothetical protein
MDMCCADVANSYYRLRKYFDGKTTADEILYREEITRRELREVIHHFDAHVSLVNTIPGVLPLLNYPPDLFFDAVFSVSTDAGFPTANCIFASLNPY